MQVKEEWSIREAVLEDAVGLRACMVSAYAAYQARLDGARLPPMDAEYSREIRDYPCWVVEANGAIGGGLIMTLENDAASIANIAVHPDFQGQGLGGKLMRHAEAVAKEKGYAELRLATHVLLTENLSLYHHLGWVEIDRDDVRVYMKKGI